jgi:hypothetical protein
MYGLVAVGVGLVILGVMGYLARRSRSAGGIAL